MIKRNLFKAGRSLAVILAATLVMSQGITALADDASSGVEVTVNDTDYTKDNDHVSTSINPISDGGLTVSSVDGSVYDDNTKKTPENDTTASVTVSGSVTNDSGSGSGGWNKSAVNATATSESSTGSSAKTEVTVNGDAVAGNINEADNSDAGVKAESYSNGTESHAKTEVTVNGNVTANGTESTTGVRVDSSTLKNGSTTAAQDNATRTASTEVNVTGNVTATSNGVTSKGIYATSSGEEASSKVKVDGNVTSTSSGQAEGINVNQPGQGGKVDIEVGGNVRADSSGYAFGVNGSAGDADVNIKVVGDVTANGEKGSEAIQIMEGKSFNVEVGGSVKQTGTGKMAFGINISDKSYSGLDVTPSISVTVAEDVTSDGSAINISKAKEESSIDVTVGGTVSGKEHNIVLESNTTTDNLNITVWKVDTTKNDKIVETFDWSKEEKYTRNTEAEKKINYIIKVSGDKQINLDGTTKVNGYDTANEGKTVYLKVDIPTGYTAEFKDVNGNSNYKIVPNGEGGAYLVVPRGGGVEVGVTLRQISGQSTSDDKNTTISQSTAGESRTESGASDGEYWSPSSSNDRGNASAAAFAGFEAIQGLQVHSMSFGGMDVALNVADVLTPVDNLTAINNFIAAGAGNLGTNNMMGAGVVSFNSMFVNSVSDTVEVPVAASVAAGQSYTVMFSDGTSVVVPCALNGVLNIPFNKAAEGLTYIIYGLQMDPSMFIGMPATNG